MNAEVWIALGTWVMAFATICIAWIANREFDYKKRMEAAQSERDTVIARKEALDKVFKTYSKLMASEQGIVLPDWPESKDQITSLLMREGGLSQAEVNQGLEELRKLGLLK